VEELARVDTIRYITKLTPPPVTPDAKPSAAPETVCAAALATSAATAAEEAENFILLKWKIAAGARKVM
jgi:hypothetical protein